MKNEVDKTTSLYSRRNITHSGVYVTRNITQKIVPMEMKIKFPSNTACLDLRRL